MTFELSAIYFEAENKVSEAIPEVDWSEYEAFFADRARWATLFVTIQEIADENKALVRELSRYDPSITVPLLASLLTLPEYQSQCIRLEILVALAVVCCQGRKKPTLDQAVRWFFQIGKSKCVAGEDPAEDVFVSLVRDPEYGDYRLLEGVWEAAGFYTQRVLEVVATMPDEGQFGPIKKSVRALLTIADIVCEKAGLHRYQLGFDERQSCLSRRLLPTRNKLISRVTISFAELKERGIESADIQPFMFHPQMTSDLPAQQIGCSYLDRCPLIVHSNEDLTVALPSALSVALRDYAIASVVEGGLAEVFDGMLATNYAQLFSETPLLGGPMSAPVHWKKSGDHRWSSFALKVDEGYFISCHLFLPSVKTHANGGFKSIYQEDGVLTEALQKSVNDSVEHFSGQPDFKEGLAILVGCGWGKGYAAQAIDPKHPKWRFESMSAADLVRLSWLEDMTPSYFWRVQDGLDAVTKAGIEFVNPNGVLNLIGWVRSNDGHFVPHAQLPEDEISPERPLILNPPLNLLRQVRADSDCGYDRHRAIDNTGTWHDVQHVSPAPFFTSESARRIFASMDDVKAGALTALYQGDLRLWMSVATPNMSKRDITYRLWEMANEWLHRVGEVLGSGVQTATKACNLKVYIEFRDGDPSAEPGEKPTPEDLVPLCIIEEHDEPNACKAVFEIGFLSGFCIAENVAERLFVRNLAHAFLHLLGEQDCYGKAEQLETRVVPNKEARSFHFFHAQHFLDYVRRTLPKLIIIDSIDDAAAKIGLGNRAIERDQGREIKGQGACTQFLAKVVDELLVEIIAALSAFDRRHVLSRLVANNEKAAAEEDHWKRTSAAILGLHGHNPETVERFVLQMSKFAGAGIASRVLSEIALCVCPSEGGARLSDIELSKLIARAALLIRYGGLSDAIHFNALAPELTISPLGDILFRDDFGRLVVEPMLSRAIGDKFISRAPLQKKNYEAPEIVVELKGKIDEEFWETWKIEMGFNLDEARNIIDTLENKGIEEHTAVLELKQNEYIALVCSDRVSQNSAVKFLDQFSLASRSQWDKPPKGFKPKDIYPWRFGRRLSFVTRPILKLDESDDPTMIVAPGALRKGFAYMFGGAYSGRLEQSFFRTKEMRDIWWGKASEGHSFNKEAAGTLADAGWQVRENIGIPELLNQQMERDFGDIDIFAWRPDRNEVLVIESKDLSLARNYSEIAAMLSNYQGAGESDKLRKHLDRVSLLLGKRDALRRFTGIQEPQILSCLVCSGVVPMQYAKIEALQNTKVGSIKEILASIS